MTMKTLSARFSPEQKTLAAIWAVAVTGLSMMFMGLSSIGQAAGVSEPTGSFTRVMSPPVEGTTTLSFTEPAISSTLPIVGGFLPEFLFVAGLVITVSAAYFDYSRKQ